MKNYTSTVPPERSIQQIDAMLVKAGAQNISKQYHQQKIVAVSFLIPCPERDGELIAIRLPANSDAVYRVLIKGKRHSYQARVQKEARDQAERTAWRLMVDWLAVQLSLIEMKQAELLQVFMAYQWNGKTTFYDVIKADRFAALTYQNRNGESHDESDTDAGVTL